MMPEQKALVGRCGGVRQLADSPPLAAPCWNGHPLRKRSMTMDYNDVAEVITTSSTSGANDLLGKGWTLLTVVAGNSGPDFVLGRHKDQPKLAGKRNSGELLGDADL
jgi:hypothetical protein